MILDELGYSYKDLQITSNLSQTSNPQRKLVRDAIQQFFNLFPSNPWSIIYIHLDNRNILLQDFVRELIQTRNKSEHVNHIYL